MHNFIMSNKYARFQIDPLKNVGRVDNTKSINTVKCDEQTDGQRQLLISPDYRHGHKKIFLLVFFLVSLASS